MVGSMTRNNIYRKLEKLTKSRRPPDVLLLAKADLDEFAAQFYDDMPFMAVLFTLDEVRANIVAGKAKLNGVKIQVA